MENLSPTKDLEFSQPCTYILNIKLDEMSLLIIFLAAIVRDITDEFHSYILMALSSGWRKSNPLHGVRITNVVITLKIPACASEN